MDLNNYLSRRSFMTSDDTCLSDDERRIPPDIIFSQAHCLATGLVGLGLRCGQSVGVWLKSSPELVITFFAVQLAGGCYVPIFWYHDEKDLAEMLKRSGCSLAIVSLEHYDTYHRLEKDLPGVRQLIVDSGEADAETTLPSNAKSLTPMLMVSKEVTLPEIEPGTRWLCYFPRGSMEPVEKYRETGTWDRMAECAGKSFGRGEKIYNALDLLDPEALLLGAVWPLLANASVALQPKKSKGPLELPEEGVDTIIVDEDSAGRLAGPNGMTLKRVLWKGEGSEERARKLAQRHGADAQPLRRAVDDAGFLS